MIASGKYYTGLGSARFSKPDSVGGPAGFEPTKAYATGYLLSRILRPVKPFYDNTFEILI